MLEKLIAVLSDCFNIGDSYHYTLSRGKEAFALGTTGLDDFREYSEEDVAEIAEHLIANGVTVAVSGRWIRTGAENVYGEIEIQCSECGHTFMTLPGHIEEERFCCKCGARMDGEMTNDDA